DPLGILAPVAVVLLLQLAVLLLTQEALPRVDVPTLALFAAALWGLHTVLVVPLRGLVYGAGARALGRPSPVLRRLPALLVVELLVAALGFALAAAIALPSTLVALFFLGRARFVLAALVLAAGALI